MCKDLSRRKDLSIYIYRYQLFQELTDPFSREINYCYALAVLRAISNDPAVLNVLQNMEFDRNCALERMRKGLLNFTSKKPTERSESILTDWNLETGRMTEFNGYQNCDASGFITALWHDICRKKSSSIQKIDISLYMQRPL